MNFYQEKINDYPSFEECVVIFKRAEKLARKSEFVARKRVPLEKQNEFFKKYNERLAKVFNNDRTFERAI
ncbi:hypothetical protein OFO01_07645 [Campylobacter sp. JMF_01 NE2]|uniref:hypothetical protein n=1 Tax=unclassified Campylobacter TaxID=2593542 RepID=UPI0022E9B5DE|nr:MULTISPECIES: hypothetical protein [unclassified Campylobacter]MDA3053324.1 hypothetical protein [Campylobacter sp. JMF_03 NE3]MDA3067656.1 hypothetical protein [Campylobacter sp. JMF_01 NE2]